MNLIELVGYLGSALVLVSFLMTSVVKLRVVNTIGSVIFAIYALIIRSYPTAIMNLCLVLINLRFLWKLRSTEPNNYRLLTLEPGERFVCFFLEHYAQDLAAAFPGRSWDEAALNRAYMVCHGEVPAGLLLGTLSEGVLDIALDYSTPAYRDTSVGRYLLEHLPGDKIRLLRYVKAEPGHLAYLQKLGFSEHDGVYELALAAK